MPRITVFFLSLLFLFSSAVISYACDDGDVTAYEIIQSYDFPVGILPQGVTGYDLDRSTGKFHAYLRGSCSFSLEGSYQLRYKSTISGYITNGKLTNLSGISVKVMFLWLNIVEVSRVGDLLEFSVGIASADFPVNNFYVCPQCGCGLDCNGTGNGDDNEEATKISTNRPLVSSV